jgi:Xaa-Pro aminopeptidase
LNEKVFERVYPTIRPGMSEAAVALALDAAMRGMGAESPSFDTIVAFGANSAKPHAMPSQRILRRGEIVLVDMGLVLDGYCSDMTRTFVAGRPDPVFTERLRIVRRAQLAAIRCHPRRHHLPGGRTRPPAGLSGRRAMENFLVMPSAMVSESTSTRRPASSRSRQKLRAGMIVTVEPGIYLPEWGGIRLENMVAVREKGCDVLNRNTTFLDL